MNDAFGVPSAHRQFHPAPEENASYTAAHLFAPGRNEFATAGQGACSATLTTTNSATLPAAGAASFCRLHRKVLY